MYVAQTQVQDEVTGDYAGGPGGLGSDELDHYGTEASALGDEEAVLVYVPGTVFNAAALGIPFTVAQIVPEGSAEDARENLESAEETLLQEGVEDVDRKSVV